MGTFYNVSLLWDQNSPRGFTFSTFLTTKIVSSLSKPNIFKILGYQKKHGCILKATILDIKRAAWSPTHLFCR
jgi:hypothetical protein